MNVADQPGLLFVVATLLPLASFVLLLLWGGLRWALRPYRDCCGGAFEALGGAVPGRGPAYVALAAIGLAFVCCAAGFVLFLVDSAEKHHLEEQIAELEQKAHDKTTPAAERKKLHKEVEAEELKVMTIDARWEGSVLWAVVRPRSAVDEGFGTT